MFPVLFGNVAAPSVLRYTNKVIALAPIAYWPMAEASGTVALDASGNARNGAYTGVTLGNVGIGDGRTAAGFDGATSYNNVYSASLNGAFTPGEFTVALWGKVSAAGVWTDGILRRLIRLRADANNDIALSKNSTNGQLIAGYTAGGTGKFVTVSTTTLGWFFLALTVSKSGDAMKAYYADAGTPFAQAGATQTGLGTWAGALASTTTIVGAAVTTPSNVWSGNMAHVPLWSTPLSAAQIATLATVP